MLYIDLDYGSELCSGIFKLLLLHHHEILLIELFGFCGSVHLEDVAKPAIACTLFLNDNDINSLSIPPSQAGDQPAGSASQITLLHIIRGD
jgi:hypothetical protein